MLAKMPKASKIKSMTPIDVAVGQRVRARRNEKGLSMEALAKVLGLTHQQVQKYERGVNRISTGRLLRICEVLDVPATALLGTDEIPSEVTLGDKLIAVHGGVELANAYLAIKSKMHRAALVTMAESLAS